MFDGLKRIGSFFRSLQGWIYLVTTAVPVTFTYLASVFEGIPWSSRIPLLMASAGAGFASAYYALLLYSYISLRYGFRKEVNDAADRLQVMRDAGTERMEIQHIADLWTDDDKEKTVDLEPEIPQAEGGN